MKKTVEQMGKERGYEAAETGGGVRALRKELPGGMEILITQSADFPDDSDAPTEVGLYSVEHGDPLREGGAPTLAEAFELAEGWAVRRTIWIEVDVQGATQAQIDSFVSAALVQAEDIVGGDGEELGDLPIVATRSGVR